MVMAWQLTGYGDSELSTSFDPTKNERVNIIHARAAVLGNVGKLVGETSVFASLHFASPKPPDDEAVMRRAKELLSRWKTS
jgi:hypothetical protein